MKAFDSFAMLDANAAVVGLVIPAEHRAAVAANLARLHGLAQEFMYFELPHEVAQDEVPRQAAQDDVPREAAQDDVPREGEQDEVPRQAAEDDPPLA